MTYLAGKQSQAESMTSSSGWRELHFGSIASKHRGLHNIVRHARTVVTNMARVARRASKNSSPVIAHCGF